MSFLLLLLQLKIKEHPVQLEHFAIINFRKTAKSRSGEEYEGTTQEIIKEELCAGPMRQIKIPQRDTQKSKNQILGGNLKIGWLFIQLPL